MRSYSQVSPKFWTGQTGKALREQGRDAQFVALYLVTCPSANMIGLYYLPLPVLCHETGLSPEGASEALRRVIQVQFAFYDSKDEIIFIPEMARYQLGETLKAKDKRRKSIQNEIDKYRKSKFLQMFMERYGKAFHLSYPSEKPEENEGASKGLRRGMHARRVEQEQEQEQDISSLSRTRVEDVPDEIEAVRSASLQAFEQWSFVSRGHGLNETANEHGPIFQLIDRLAAKPPIPLANGVVGQQTLIPRAAECLKIDRENFKSVKYAVGCVENKLDDWSREGVPGPGPPRRSSAPSDRASAVLSEAIAKANAGVK